MNRYNEKKDTGKNKKIQKKTKDIKNKKIQKIKTKRYRKNK
jgi:hypothetical protein